MMKTTLTTIFLVLFVPALFAQNSWSDKSRILPDKLRQLPVGLRIEHSPDPVYPTINSNKKANKAKYIWQHSTTVVATEKTLKVVEVGSFIWISENGWIGNMRYTIKDFEERFACPNGVLIQDQAYTFEENNRYGDELYGGDALWYVLAKDSEGTIYKGFAILETESEFKKQ